MLLMCCTNCLMNKQRKKKISTIWMSMFQNKESNRIERDFDEGREKRNNCNN